MDLVPGYREVRQLGAGHTGRVFLATYQSTGAYVAIKYLNATLRRDAEFMDRFRSDTHRLVEIDDPNVVRLYEYVETPTRAAVVMELVDGVSLRTLLAEHRGTSPEAALAVLKSTLLALAAAHEKGVPHRDVKPENVLVQADGTSKLADFGIVVHAEEPGVPAGSPEYMSPELWTQHRAGPPADLYAAACVLFEAVKGRPPFRAHREDEEGTLDVPATRDKHLVEPVPLEVVPDTLRDLLRRGLAKDPAVRYASARQFAAELEEDAVAGYGPDWEKRGRRHLAELATLLALRFPLARTDRAAGGAPITLRDRLLRMPRLPPHLWVAGATVVAVAIALMLSGGRLPPGPGAILMPPPEAKSEPEPSRVSSPSPARTTAAAPRRTTTAPSATPPLPSLSTPPSTPPPPPPTAGQGGTAGPGLAVQAASIVQWSGTSGSITVAADGTGPVRLRITYTRRDGDDAPARTVRRETRTLRGSTVYTSSVAHDPGNVACGRRAYLGILVMTEPASGNGPQVSEAAVDGPACPTPAPTRSAPPTPTPAPTEERSTSAIGTPTPSDPAPTDNPLARQSGEPSGRPSAQPLSSPTEEPVPEPGGEPPSDE
ncbi:serine/threonine-protein kinase [Nonomuraea basaltis]|uniref:serine/threonine-protein kinase n=1 Tax=Nonomuraea basaltis TaxID=2495887 RepID=UPI001485C5F7|nr:serine/threonine-protein kinase [Nonomuraea basaltis]